MRIAVNTRLLIKGKMDGIGWFAYETVRRIVAWHPEHEFFFFFDRPPSPEFVMAENVRAVVLWPPARHPLLWYAYFEGATRWALRHYKIDLYLSPDGFMPLHAGVPTVNVIHDINFAHHPGNLKPSHQLFMDHFFPRYARRADRLVTVSDFSRRDIAATYGVDVSRIGVVYNGANEIYRPIGDSQKADVRQRYTGGRPYFIFVSTIHRRKNLQGVLRSFDRLKEDASRAEQLVVVGSRKYWAGEPEEAYNAMVHKADVHFMGHIAPEDLSRLVAAATALVYPSFFEGFGIPIVEAFYAETAVITSTTTSMPEVAGDAALLVDPASAEQLHHAMLLIATNGEFRHELIERGRQRRALFSWDNTARQLWDEMMLVAR